MTYTFVQSKEISFDFELRELAEVAYKKIGMSNAEVSSNFECS
jgi:hypothetical protein